jgi:hypothetical protein
MIYAGHLAGLGVQRTVRITRHVHLVPNALFRRAGPARAVSFCWLVYLSPYSGKVDEGKLLVRIGVHCALHVYLHLHVGLRAPCDLASIIP